MQATIVNAIAILVGSLIGLLFSKGIKESYQDALMSGIALVVFVIGLQGALETNNMILVIASIVIGTFLGEIINIERKLNQLGDFLERKVGKEDSNISTAFVSASLIYCIGAMAIVGALESGISANHDTLYAKSMLDGISSILFAATLGVGVMFSSFAVFVYQGSITLLASLLSPLFTQALIQEISAIGGILIMAIALNMMEIKKIRIGNMLPAIFVPMVYTLLIHLFK